MKFSLVCLCLAVAFGVSQCSPQKILKMMSLAMGPPTTLDECLEDMQAGFKLKMGMIERIVSLKLECKKKSMPEDLVKCLPEDGVFKNTGAKVTEIKELWAPVKQKFAECLKKKAESKEGCSNEPKTGPCDMKIMKSMFPEDVKEKVGECIMKEGISSLPELIKDAVLNNMKNDGRKAKAQKFLDDFDNIAGIVKAIKGPIGGKKMKDKKPGPKRGMDFMKLLGKGMSGPMCLKLFCERATVNECMDEAGVAESMGKMFETLEAIAQSWEEKFPDVCSCMSKSESATAKLKEVMGIEKVDCEKLPKLEACGKLMLNRYTEMKKEMMGEFSEKSEPPAASRRRRSLDSFIDMNFDDFNFDLFD